MKAGRRPPGIRLHRWAVLERAMYRLRIGQMSLVLAAILVLPMTAMSRVRAMPSAPPVLRRLSMAAGASAALLLVFAVTAAPVRASSQVESLGIPIADPGNAYEGRFDSCELEFTLAACTLPTPDGGILIFGVDLVHVSSAGVATVLDSRAFGGTVAATDGTIWTTWTEPCALCFETTLLHLSADGSVIDSFPFRDVLPGQTFNHNIELLSADAGGVWVHGGTPEYLGYIDVAGVASSDLTPTAGVGKESSVRLVTTTNSGSMIWWQVRDESSGRITHRAAAIDTGGALTGEGILPRLRYEGMAQQPDGTLVLSARRREMGDPVFVVRDPLGACVTYSVPHKKGMWRNALSNPVLLTSGEAYLPVERFEVPVRSGDPYRLHAGQVKRVYSDVPGVGKGPVIWPLASLGESLGIVAGRSRSQGPTHVRIISAGQASDVSAHLSTGWPGFAGDGSLIWVTRQLSGPDTRQGYRVV